MTVPPSPFPPSPFGEPAWDTWQRLDPRMLLVHPIRELINFLPVLVGLVVAGGLSGGAWPLFGVAVPVGLGVVRYLTTTYRVTDARVELRRGLVRRHNLSTPLDRVRTVDLTASPIHRILGLARIVIGTGSAADDDDERMILDALPREEAAALRGRLLAPLRSAHAALHGHAPPESVIARFSAQWLWYAPFSGAVLVAAGAVVGTASQLLGSIDLRISEQDLAVFSPAVVATLAVIVLLVVAALFVLGYLVVNGNFILARQGATWHIRRGLLTHHETTIDVDRLAGLSIAEPAALRVARGRRVSAIVTGLRRRQASSALLLPPAPRRTAVATATAVLGDERPVTGPLRSHGRSATTRRFTRALLVTSPVVVAVVVAVALGGPGALTVLAVLAMLVALALATDRARSLGHAHLAGHVVMRSGSVLRSRDALADRHVIGWNLRATWFQRRAGLVSLSATTAGGAGRIAVPDVPTGDAIALALAATPGLLEEFLA